MKKERSIRCDYYNVDSKLVSEIALYINTKILEWYPDEQFNLNLVLNKNDASKFDTPKLPTTKEEQKVKVEKKNYIVINREIFINECFSTQTQHSGSRHYVVFKLPTYIPVEVETIYLTLKLNGRDVYKAAIPRDEVISDSIWVRINRFYKNSWNDTNSDYEDRLVSSGKWYQYFALLNR